MLCWFLLCNSINQPCVCMCAKPLQLCATLCDPMDYSPQGFSVLGILQARILEQAAIPSSRGSSRPRDQTCVSCIAGGFFTTEPPGKPKYIHIAMQLSSPPSTEHFSSCKTKTLNLLSSLYSRLMPEFLAQIFIIMMLEGHFHFGNRLIRNLHSFYKKMIEK